MKVLILGTGRTGSQSFIKACKHIRNFSSAHESKVNGLGDDRFSFPDQHIEADCRLVFHLGEMEKYFGKDTYYVHLKRDKEEIARSYAKRYRNEVSIVRAFAEGIKNTPLVYLTEEERLQNARDYVSCVHHNLAYYFKDKPHVMEIDLADIKSGFKTFWDWIGAEGDLEKALATFDVKHNASPKKPKGQWRVKLKHALYGLKKGLKGKN